MMLEHIFESEEDQSNSSSESGAESVDFDKQIKDHEFADTRETRSIRNIILNQRDKLRVGRIS